MATSISSSSARLLFVLLLRALLVVDIKGSDEGSGSASNSKCDVKGSMKCDGKNDCPDKSDEKGCPCPNPKFKCHCYDVGCSSEYGCIDHWERCDGHNDCGDWSDEKECNCPNGTFTCESYEAGCSSEYGCIDHRKRCDGHNDCGDWSDEKECNCPNGTFTCECYEAGCSSEYGCINHWDRCDGHNDCGDWSDEKQCNCPNGTFTCECYEAGCSSEYGCINHSKRCDGHNDCGDWSDEKECNCPNGTFTCECYEAGCSSEYGCINHLDRCDGHNDCGDWSDEKECNCPNGTFTCECYEAGCSSEYGCINDMWRCDGDNDCGDWSDEKECNCPNGTFACESYEAGCSSEYGCLNDRKRCDGYNDCGDWSDEKECNCPNGTFTCECYEAGCSSEYGCINHRDRCDGVNDCGDWSDEKECNCSNGTFTCECYEAGCSSNNGCINDMWRCDGHNDCGDWSDEKECNCPNGTFTCECYEAGCSSNDGCINHWDRCDGHNDCGDWSDEKECNCPNGTFTCECYEAGCSSEYGCINHRKRCDGHNDCGDWSDERDCNCSETKFQCVDGECIDRTKVNDGKNDCKMRDDEFLCNNTGWLAKCGCLNNDHCTSSGRCILETWIGDTISDCEQHDDEPCNATKIWCSDCWIIKYRCLTDHDKAILLRNSPGNSTRCHSLFIRSEETQNLETTWICMKSPCRKCLNMFQCKNGQIIDNDHYCDAIRHCIDGSDELKTRFGFRCSGKSRMHKCVLPQKNVYDSVAQCADRSDLCFVKGEFQCFSCLDERLIVSAKQVCDGIVDCYDMSDECLCQNQSVCNAVLGEEMSRCPPHHMHCYNGTDCLDMDKVLCNLSVDCENRRNRLFCHQHQTSDDTIRCFARNATLELSVVNAALCDGQPECSRMEDECNCERRPSFCDGLCAKHLIAKNMGNFKCNGYHEREICSFCNNEDEKNCLMRFYCKSKDMINIDKRKVCDGVYDCDDQSDENSTNCSEKRFYCSKGNAVSINKDFVCDGIKDCDNGDDEDNQLCEEKRFYCDSEQPISVDKKSVGNGIKDCSDGSDECISMFSSRYEMISHALLRAIFWIMGLFALFGNMIINLFTTKRVFSRKCNVVKLANNIFIMNLTISDFLMGVYLIAVVAQGKRFSGFYCFVDKEWRSSKLCSALGTLALVSSETSAFILTAMSTFRLVTTYKPFLSSSIKIKWIVISGCWCWFSSIFLAILPLFPFDSGYFISDVWFPNTFSKTDTISKIDTIALANRVSGNNSDLKSWFKIKDIISETFKYNSIKGEFGYYGETSVCMPRIYTSTNEAAWQYSTFLITLNFVLFLYMIVAYVLVYKSVFSAKPIVPDGKDPNKRLQKRISRLLLTDFCCWIPVCTMGYLSIAGVALPHNAYILSAGFLLPINSAMNPVVYSKLFGRCASRAKKWFIKNFFTIFSSSPHENDVVVPSEFIAERREMRITWPSEPYMETELQVIRIDT